MQCKINNAAIFAKLAKIFAKLAKIFAKLAKISQP